MGLQPLHCDCFPDGPERREREILLCWWLCGCRASRAARPRRTSRDKGLLRRHQQAAASDIYIYSRQPEGASSSGAAKKKKIFSLDPRQASGEAAC